MVQKMKAKDRRTFVVMVRLNRAERAELAALAAFTGEDRAGLVRRLISEEAKIQGTKEGVSK